MKAVDEVERYAVAASDAITIDLTPPIAPASGSVWPTSAYSAPLRAFLAIQSDVPISWLHFTDAESGILSQAVSILTANGSAVWSTRTLAGSVNSFVAHGVVLVPADEYQISVIARNGAGAFSANVTSTTFRVDWTPPVCSYVKHQIVTDAGGSISLDTLTVLYDCDDLESGVLSLRIGLGTYPGANDVMPLVPVSPGLLSFTSTDLQLTPGFSYYWVVALQNGAGVESFTHSDGLRLDNTPPTVDSMGLLIGGVPGASLDWWHRNTSIQFQYLAFDLESGISTVEVGVATTQSSALDYIDWTLVLEHNTANFPSSGNVLQHGETYYLLMRVTNGVNLTAPILRSDAFTIDLTPPICSHLVDGDDYGIETAYTSSSSVGANWDCSDPESGVFDTTLALLQASTGVEIVPEMSVGMISSYWQQLSATQVQPGGRYVTQLRVTNNARVSIRTQSHGITFDDSPPSIAPLVVTSLPDVNFTALHEPWSSVQTNRTAILMSWPDFTDAESGMCGLDFYIGTSFMSSDISSSTPVNPSQTSTLVTGLDLDNGHDYFLTMVGTNCALLSTTITSMITIAAPVPQAGTSEIRGVYPTGLDPLQGDFMTGMTVEVDWVGFSDPVADLAGYIVELIVEDATIVLQWPPISQLKSPLLTPDILTFSFVGLNYTSTNGHGPLAKATITVINRAGVSAVVETSQKELPYGQFSPGKVANALSLLADTGFQSSTDELVVSFLPFFTPFPAPLRYEWGLGETDQAPNLMDFRYVPTRVLKARTSEGLVVLSKNNFTLSIGKRYYGFVRAHEPTTNSTVVAVSRGTMPIQTPPTCDRLFMSTINGSALFTRLPLTVQWLCADIQSVAFNVEIALGSLAGGSDLLSYTVLPPNTTAFTVPTEIAASGVEIFATITATNGARLSTTLQSEQGVKYHASAPITNPVEVYDDAGVQINKIDRPLSYLEISWPGWYDRESLGLVYSWCVGVDVLECNILPWQPTLATTVNISISDLAAPYSNWTYLTSHALTVQVKAVSPAVEVWTTPRVVSLPVMMVAPDLVPGSLILVGSTGTRPDGVRVQNHTNFVDLSWILRTYASVVDTIRLTVTAVNVATGDLSNSSVTADGMQARFFGLRIAPGDVYDLYLTACNAQQLCSNTISISVLADALFPAVSNLDLSSFATADTTGTWISPSSASLRVQWSLLGAPASGIATVEFAFCSSNSVVGLQTYSDFLITGNASLVCPIPMFQLRYANTTNVSTESLSLQNGQQYTAILRVTSNAGVAGNAFANVLVDYTPPTIGVLSIANSTSSDSAMYVQSVESTILCWSGFTDAESGIRGYSVCFGTSIEACDVISRFVVSPDQMCADLTGEEVLLSPKIFFVTVDVTNNAGQEVHAYSSALYVTPLCSSRRVRAHGL